MHDRDDTLAPARRRPQTAPLGIKSLLALLAGTCLLAGCEINKPEMPSFESSFCIPLGVERIEAITAVEDEENLVVGDDGQLEINFSGDPDTLSLTCDLSTDVQQQSITAELGNFTIASPSPLFYFFELGDILPAASGVSGLLAPVPAFTINVTSPDQDIPDVTAATLAAGWLTMTVTNNLPVSISADQGEDQLALVLEDPGTAVEVATLVFGLILPGETAAQTVDLAGKTLPDAVAVSLTGASAGSGGELVTINGSDSIAIMASLSDLVVSSAVAVVEAQNFSSSCTIDLPGEYGITQADIASGELTLDLTNELSVPCSAQVTWPEILDLDGQSLAVTLALDPGQSGHTAIDLAGMTVESGGQPLAELVGQLDVATPGSGGQPVTLTATDILSAELGGSQVVFSSITGTVPCTSWDLDPVSEGLDLPDELDGIELVAASLVLNLVNTADLPAELDLTVTGTDANGESSTLQVTEQIAPARDRSPATTIIVLDQTNSTIVELLNCFPDTITLNGSVTLGGDEVIGTIRQGDFAVIDWNISAPIEIIVTGTTITGDPSLLDVDEDIQEIIQDKALGARVDLEVLNHLPVGLELRILACQDTTSILTDPQIVIGPLVVAAAAVDGDTGVVSEAVISRPQFTLDRDQARLFGQPGLHTVIEAVLPASEGNPVRMMATDFLEVRGIITLEVLVDDNW